MIRYPKIREFRILHDLKQEFVADQLGISQPEYSRLENGFRKARLEDFKTLAKVYDVSINVLMLREEEHYYDKPKRKSNASPFHEEHPTQRSFSAHPHHELIGCQCTRENLDRTRQSCWKIWQQVKCWPGC